MCPFTYHLHTKGDLAVRKLGWMLGSFAAMYTVATVVGFATYLLISPLAMWISVFTLMPIVSALLVYGYLHRLRFSPASSLSETIRLLLFWVGLSFTLDALTYILVVPAVKHTPPNWAFFQEQSPWIWLSYAVLLISAFIGRWLYLRRKNA